MDFDSFLFGDDMEEDLEGGLPTSLFDGEFDAVVDAAVGPDSDNAIDKFGANDAAAEDPWGFGNHSVIDPIDASAVQVPLYEMSTEEEEPQRLPEGATGFVLPSSIASTGRLRGALNVATTSATLDSIAGGTNAASSAPPAVSFANDGAFGMHGTRTRAPPPPPAHWGDDHVQKVVGTPEQSRDANSAVAIGLPTLSEANKMASVAATLLQQQQQQSLATDSVSRAQKSRREEDQQDKQNQEREKEEKEERERMLDEKHVREHYSDHSRAHTNRPTIQQRVQAKTLDQVFDALSKMGALLQKAVDVMIEHHIPLPPRLIPLERENFGMAAAVDSSLRGLLNEMYDPMYVLTLGNLIDSFFSDRNAATGHALNEKIGGARTCIAILLKVFFSAFGGVFTHSQGSRFGTLQANFSQPIVPDGALTLSDVRLRRSLATDCRYALPIVTEEHKRALKANCEKQVNIRWMVDGDNDWRKIVTQNSNPLMFVIRRISERYGVPSPHVLFELIEMDVHYPHTWQRLVYLTSDAVKQAEQARREQIAQSHQKEKSKKQPVSAAVATMDAIKRRSWFKFTDFCDQVQCGMLPWMDYASRLDSTRCLSLNEIVRNMSSKIRQESFATLNQKFTKFLYRSNPSVFANQSIPFHMHRAVFRYLWNSITVNPSRNLMQFLAYIDKNKISTLLRLLCAIDQLEDALQPAHYLHCLVNAHRRKMLHDLVLSIEKIEQEEAEKGVQEQSTTADGLDWRRAVERPISESAKKRILSWLDLRCSRRPGQVMIVERRYDDIFNDLRVAHETNDAERLRKYAMIVERDTWLYPLPVIVRFMRQTSEGVHETVANADNYMNNPPTSHGRVNTNHHDPREKNVYYMAIYHAKYNNLKQTATVVHLNGPFAGTAFKSPTAAINHVLIGNSCCSGPKELSVLVIERSNVVGANKGVVYNCPLTDDPEKYSAGRPKWVNLEMYVREQSRGRFGFFSAVDDLPAALKQRPIPYKMRLDAEEKEKGQYVEVEHKNVQYNGRRRNISQHVHVGALTHCVQSAFETLVRESTIDAESVVPAGSGRDDAVAREQIEAAIAEKGYAQLYREHVLASLLLDDDERQRDLFMSRFSESLLEQQPLCVNTIMHPIIAPPHTIVENRDTEDIERISRRKKKSDTEKEREKRRVAREHAQAEEVAAKRKTFAIMTQRQEVDLQSKAEKKSSSPAPANNKPQRKKRISVSEKKQVDTRSDAKNTTSSKKTSGIKRKTRTAAAAASPIPSRVSRAPKAIAVSEALVVDADDKQKSTEPKRDEGKKTPVQRDDKKRRCRDDEDDTKGGGEGEGDGGKDKKTTEMIIGSDQETVLLSPPKKKPRLQETQELTMEQKKEAKQRRLDRLIALAKKENTSLSAPQAIPKKKKKLTWKEKCAQMRT